MSSASTTPMNVPTPEGSPRSDDLDLDEDQRPQWLVVTSGAETFAIPVEQVREVVRPMGLHPVPGAPAIQAGIVNVRGAIVTVLDLSALRSRERAVTAGSIVILEHGARPIGLAVDTVQDVRMATPAQSDRPADATILDAVALCARHLHSDGERSR